MSLVKKEDGWWINYDPPKGPFESRDKAKQARKQMTKLVNAGTRGISEAEILRAWRLKDQGLGSPEIAQLTGMKQKTIEKIFKMDIKYSAEARQYRCKGCGATVIGACVLCEMQNTSRVTKTVTRTVGKRKETLEVSVDY